MHYYADSQWALAHDLNEVYRALYPEHVNNNPDIRRGLLYTCPPALKLFWRRYGTAPGEFQVTRIDTKRIAYPMAFMPAGKALWVRYNTTEFLWFEAPKGTYTYTRVDGFAGSLLHWDDPVYQNSNNVKQNPWCYWSALDGGEIVCLLQV